ncbi:MAG: hypothetical protein FWD72_03390, partial [Eggerthellaceae bacterium]|nr:hypothetical protein [Eggerthellaceae bacterium]
EKARAGTVRMPVMCAILRWSAGRPSHQALEGQFTEKSGRYRNSGKKAPHKRKNGATTSVMVPMGSSRG